MCRSRSSRPCSLRWPSRLRESARRVQARALLPELSDVRSPFNRHAVWQIAADAVIIAAAWTLAWLLRFDQGRPIYYDHYLDWQIILIVVGIQLTVFALAGFYNRWWRYVSTRDMWAALRGVCLRLARDLHRLHAVRVPSRRGCRRASGSSTCSSASPSSPARACRPHADRAAAARSGRGAWEGGDRRRSGRRRPARDQGDAAQPGARLHPDRDRRRRPAQAQPAAARDPRPRDDGRSAAA